MYCGDRHQDTLGDGLFVALTLLINHNTELILQYEITL